MKIEIIRYEPKHAEIIMETNPRKQEQLFAKLGDWGKWIFIWAEHPSYTLIIDGDIVMCAGVIMQHPRTGEAWMILSSLFYKYKKECFKAVKENLDKIIDEFKLKRVQALVVTDFPEAEHWLRHLGFKNDTPNAMESYWNGTDMFMYGRKCG